MITICQHPVRHSIRRRARLPPPLYSSVQQIRQQTELRHVHFEIVIDVRAARFQGSIDARAPNRFTIIDISFLLTRFRVVNQPGSKASDEEPVRGNEVRVKARGADVRRLDCDDSVKGKTGCVGITNILRSKEGAETSEPD